jgi:hypothetical protein
VLAAVRIVIGSGRLTNTDRYLVQGMKTSLATKTAHVRTVFPVA